MWSAEPVLSQGARAALQSQDPVARAAAAELAGDGGWEWVPAAMVGLLRQPERGVREAASAALERLASAAVANGSAASGSLHGALAQAAAEWPDHRMAGVFQGAIAVLDPGGVAFGGRSDPLAGWFLDGTSESHMGLRSAVRKGESPVTRLRAWEWLGRGVMAVAALERVGRASTQEEHEAVLRKAHLLVNPVRARRVGMLKVRDKEAAALWPDAAAFERLSNEARGGLARFVHATTAQAGVKARVLEPLLADRVGSVRLAGLRVLPDAEAADFCFDGDEPLARHAALRVGASLDPRALSLLGRSPHASVRRIAGEEVGRAECWNPASAPSRLAAQRALAQDRESFLREVRARIAGGARADRLRAIMLARSIGIAHGVELELLAIAASPGDDWLAATAVAALGEVGSPSAADAVRRSVRHDAGRVRSNAAEAVLRGVSVGDRAAPLDHSVVELKSDPHHRARASVLRALLAGSRPLDPGAMPDLAAMLTDGRPLHRLAALWAVERLALAPAPGSGGPVVQRLGEFSTLVAQVARDEPEEPVRERATRCAARLLARVRLMWRESAAAGSEAA